jgi:pyruvate, water dikinase
MEPIRILSGRVAQRGKVEGLARIINSYVDLESIKEGDILVTAQTDMNYTPYLQGCIGLITEMGGSYCHAAIYSRENSLPCITDVTDARKLLVNGSLIVLDANKNEVYKK